MDKSLLEGKLKMIPLPIEARKNAAITIEFMESGIVSILAANSRKDTNEFMEKISFFTENSIFFPQVKYAIKFERLPLFLAYCQNKNIGVWRKSFTKNGQIEKHTGWIHAC